MQRVHCSLDLALGDRVAIVLIRVTLSLLLLSLTHYMHTHTHAYTFNIVVCMTHECTHVFARL